MTADKINPKNTITPMMIRITYMSFILLSWLDSSSIVGAMSIMPEFVLTDTVELVIFQFYKTNLVLVSLYPKFFSSY